MSIPDRIDASEETQKEQPGQGKHPMSGPFAIRLVLKQMSVALFLGDPKMAVVVLLLSL